MLPVYLECYCRFCNKYFCCAKCRFKHEQKKHSLEYDCDLCIYGKMYFNNVDVLLLKHIENTHLPLHCLICKRVFSKILELNDCKCMQHNCKTLSTVSLISERTDTHLSENNSCNSFFAMNIIPITITTSTPMGGDFERMKRINYSELSSPSEQIEKTSGTDKMIEKVRLINENIELCPTITPLRSIITKSALQTGSVGNNKRRVTFSDIEFVSTHSSIEVKSNHIAVHNCKISQTFSCCAICEKSCTSNIKCCQNSPVSVQDSNFYYYTTYENYNVQEANCMASPINISSASNNEQNSQNENFYTPTGPSCSLREMGQNLDSDNLLNKTKNNSSTSGNIWTSMAKILKNMYTHVKSVTASLSEFDELDSFVEKPNKPSKRYLSPGSVADTVNPKKLCIRGRKPISRMNDIEEKK